MISWLTTNSIAPAAPARPQGSRAVEALTIIDPATAAIGSIKPDTEATAKANRRL